MKVYELERELGKGSYGTVYLGRHKEMGYHRAVKKLPKGNGVEDSDELINEICALMDLDHPHITKLSRLYDDGQNLFIVSEFNSGPCLHDRLIQAPMSEQEAGVALRHILKAVTCCHSHYMGHYDVKLDNFMFSNPDCKSLKMIDLGLSSGFKRDPTKLKGTIAYMAPEVFHGMYGPEADLWSCGAVLFAMTTRTHLCPATAEAEEVAALVQDRRWVKERLTHVTDASDECLDLLRKMLCCDRHMRITAAEALKHPYILNSYHNSTQKRKDRRKEEAALAVIKSMVDRFAEFGAEPVLVRASLLLMVHIAGYISKETHTHRLAYAMLDRDGFGELSVEGIEAVLPKHGLPLPPNLDDAFGCVDLAQNGYITYTNFLSATLPVGLRCREDLCRRVFSLLDHNHDGFIDQDDLMASFLSQEERSNEEFRDLCHEAIAEVAGFSGKKRLDFDDFVRVIVGKESPIAAHGFKDL